MARADNLDNDLPRTRTQEHTNTLVEELELGVLWDEYGLVGDIVVRILLIFNFNFIRLPFISSSSSSSSLHYLPISYASTSKSGTMILYYD